MTFWLYASVCVAMEEALQFVFQILINKIIQKKGNDSFTHPYNHEKRIE